MMDAAWEYVGGTLARRARGLLQSEHGHSRREGDKFDKPPALKVELQQYSGLEARVQRGRVGEVSDYLVRQLQWSIVPHPLSYPNCVNCALVSNPLSPCLTCPHPILKSEVASSPGADLLELRLQGLMLSGRCTQKHSTAPYE